VSKPQNNLEEAGEITLLGMPGNCL